MPVHPFGLSENPFADGHDQRYVYPARKRVEAVALLRKRIADGESFVAITGEPGCGKTSLVTELFADPAPKPQVAFIAHPSLTPSELLEAICIEFGARVPTAPSKPQTLAALDHHLRGLRKLGSAAVLVLDEAHRLDTDLLEEARLLSNMKAEGRGLLQTILVGVPELERRLGLPELAQLRQRVTVHCRMLPLTAEETEGYVHHRVGAAGGDGAALFPSETCRELHNYTDGFPRALNTLAGRALECAEQDGADAVRVEHVRIAASDARPQGIAPTPRASSGPQPFELRRTARPSYPAPQAARVSPPPPERAFVPPPERAFVPPPERAFVAPPERALVPPPPPRPTEAAPAPPPSPPEIRTPPSFLRTQQIARAGDAMVSAGVTVGPGSSMPERRSRGGDVAAAEPGGDKVRPTKGTRGLFGESVRELGASVFLVGTLVVVLMATGRWNPVLPPLTRPSAEPTRSSQVSEVAEVASEPTGPSVAIVSDEPLAVPPAELPAEPLAEPPADPPLPAPKAAAPAVVPPPPNPAQDPVATMPDLSLGGTRGSQGGIGFEVASTFHPDSAAATLRKIMRGSKLPCRIVTKSSGDTYRVVVGPFATRREAEKAITELFRHALVERARIIQLVE